MLFDAREVLMAGCENSRWYRYDQNNSGGFFIVDEEVDANLFIQAENEEDAERIMLDVTRSSADNYCDCCG